MFFVDKKISPFKTRLPPVFPSVRCFGPGYRLKEFPLLVVLQRFIPEAADVNTRDFRGIDDLLRVTEESGRVLEEKGAYYE